MSQWLINAWYQKNPWLNALRPLAWVFRGVVRVRRWLWQRRGQRSQFAVPVIVVGNLTVGGSGKTPLVLALLEWLKAQGQQPGVVSRGYGGQGAEYPCLVDATSLASKVGDEPLLIARRSGCPVVVDPNRVRAVQTLLSNTDCTVVISDDGLQHYALHRDVEIVVVDGQRRFGNELCLPAGPLREPLSRLKQVDAVVVNGGAPLPGEWLMQLQPSATLCRVAHSEHTQPVAALAGQVVHAVAGIGNPERFFAQLRAAGCTVITHAFPDHHRYTAQDLAFADDYSVVMTEKDAVKCVGFAGDSVWYWPVTAVLPAEFWERLTQTIRKNNG